MSSKSFIRVKRSEWDFIKATQKEQKCEDRGHANYIGNRYFSTYNRIFYKLLFCLNTNIVRLYEQEPTLLCCLMRMTGKIIWKVYKRVPGKKPPENPPLPVKGQG